MQRMQGGTTWEGRKEGRKKKNPPLPASLPPVAAGRRTQGDFDNNCNSDFWACLIDAGLLQEMLHAARTGKGSVEWKVCVCVCVCVCDFFPPLSFAPPSHSSFQFVRFFLLSTTNGQQLTGWWIALQQPADWLCNSSSSSWWNWNCNGSCYNNTPSTTAAIAMPDEEDYVLMMMMMQVVNDTDKQAYDHCHQSFVIFFLWILCRFLSWTKLLWRWCRVLARWRTSQMKASPVSHLAFFFFFFCLSVCLS